MYKLQTGLKTTRIRVQTGLKQLELQTGLKTTRTTNWSENNYNYKVQLALNQLELQSTNWSENN